MKILIPMAGNGSRFKTAGYLKPKPFIDVAGKIMIERVVENLGIEHEYIFLTRAEHFAGNEKDLASLMIKIGGRGKVLMVDSLTEGACCTALLAKDLINTDDELLIANADQVIDYQKENFDYIRKLTSVDGIILSFNASDPKWSFIKLGQDGYASQIAEKKPISDIATCGIYWYRKGSNFVKYAEEMITRNIRVNKEFYIAPVYNQMIKDKGKIIPFFVDHMHGLGTPEDLKEYIEYVKSGN
jgi:dTDP-glucose pyrophosphorylase